jgi:dTDP-4-dehydrorhamnose reductase
LGDADLVANFALATGTPRAAHDIHAAIIEHSIRFSPPAARVIYFSTLAVYGDPALGTLWRIRSAYAREKLRCEHLALRLGRRYRKPVYVLRLGHVTGSLQAISHLIREAAAAGPISLPDPARRSNTTHVATIADAICAIAAGRERPGLYDLVNVPQWTWHEVVGWEAAERGVESRIDASVHTGDDDTPLMRRLSRRLASWVAAHPTAKEYALQALAVLSPALNRKAQAMNAVSRAAREIAALSPPPRVVTDAMNWRELSGPALATLTETRQLLIAERSRAAAERGKQTPWPDDMPDACPEAHECAAPRAAGYGQGGF